MSYTLLIGSKNYSSWSLRPWLLLHAFGVPFTEERHIFDTPEFAAEILSRKRSPNGKVPVLVDGDITVWDVGDQRIFGRATRGHVARRNGSASACALRLRRNAFGVSGCTQLAADECAPQLSDFCTA